MDVFVGLLASFAAIGGVVTTTMYVIRGFADKPGKWPAAVINVLAVVIGIAYCLGWQIDLSAQAFSLVPALAKSSTRLGGVWGQVLTGIAAAAFATFLHELFDALRGIAGKGPISARWSGATNPAVEPPRK